MDLRSKDAIESSKQHEIDMKNILIAEFMGMQESDGEYYKKLYNSGDWFRLNELQFNTSWDWLVPVLKKANEIISDNQKGLWRMLTHPFEYEIKDVHEQVVDFINYYNYENK